MVLYMNVNNNDSNQRKTTCMFLHIQKRKNMRNVYIYIQKSRHFAKRKTIYVTFLYTKIQTLDITIFSWKIWNWHLYVYKKHDTLRYVTFLYANIQTLRKKQDNLRYVFLYTKIRRLCVTQFVMEILELAEGGGGECMYRK